MRIGINQFCWPMGTDLAEALQKSAALGYGSFEACLTAWKPQPAGGGVTDALDIASYRNPLLNEASSDANIRAVGKMAREAGIEIGSIGGILSFSIYPLTSRDAAVAAKAVDGVKRMIDAAHLLGAKTVLVIPGMLDKDTGYEEGYALAQQRVAELAGYAKGGVVLGIENVWNNMLYSPLEINRFIDETGCKNLGVYFDVANARRFGYPEQWVRTFAHRIVGVHAKDYRMGVDNINGFTNILDGDVDWPAVLAALQEVHYSGDVVVELIPPAQHMVEETLAHAHNALQKMMDKLKEENGI